MMPVPEGETDFDDFGLQLLLFSSRKDAGKGSQAKNRDDKMMVTPTSGMDFDTDPALPFV